MRDSVKKRVGVHSTTLNTKKKTEEEGNREKEKEVKMTTESRGLQKRNIQNTS